jgi:ATP-dependent DNA helicase RecG
VQKKEELTENERKMLRKEKLIEGKYPNVFVTAKVAAITDKKAQYIKNRAFDKEYYKNLILEYLKEYGSASRNDIESLLTDKLPDFMDAQQKYRKISSIIKELSQKENKIVNTSGSTRFSNWKLVD